MLTQLYIKNFTLIDTLDIDFRPGFSVITGETGAGKSIILGAIGLLLGQRADSKTIKHGAEKCVIEAHFELSHYDMKSFFTENDIEYDASDCIIRRELTTSGKSRAFINDTPVALTMLKELGDRLVDIHSQHQNLLLNKHDFQLNIVDIIAQDNEHLKTYNNIYKLYYETEQQLDKLRHEIEQSRQNLDFLQFQYEELTNANLISGEQEELEATSEKMSHAEEIKTALYNSSNNLSGDQCGAVKSIRKAQNEINRITNVMPGASELARRLNTAYIELKDISEEVESMLVDIAFDPSELDDVNNRLDRIYDLQKKYRCNNINELISLREGLKRKLSDIENSDDTLDELEAQLSQYRKDCQHHADILTALRKKAATVIEKEMLSRLISLGMPNIRFKVEVINSGSLSSNGQDKVSMMFSANTSTPMQPIAQVASGGEIARVMLAMKAMISGAVKLPTIIFDEIDTGVSGKIAEKMAEIMYEMGGQGRQVISITHLPQIAAKGTSHYKVFKEETNNGTTSRMQLLTADERINEIAQMLSGSDISEAAINNAKELLRN